ncbi:MAG: transketolase [Bacteroidetes bacterium]|nr:MAG: transketolase [Bacteroidota bacterium]
MPLSDSELKSLKEKAAKLRNDIVDVTFWAGGAHIGGAMSMVDIITILYNKFMKFDSSNPDLEDRDRFVLSKGHTGVGLAPLLAEKGFFDKETLKTFNQFNSPFGMHLDSLKVRGLDASTGSLGHGMPISLGMALAARVKGLNYKTYCLIGDGEMNEGSNWEAIMAAAHYKVTSLIPIVDFNKRMIDGEVKDIMSIDPLADKWKAFGFDVIEINGHDFNQLNDAIEKANAAVDRPVVIIANTIKGKGIDFMEDQTKWHYGSIDSTVVEKAKASIAANS